MPHFPAALSARLDTLRNDPVALIDFEQRLRAQRRASKTNSARTSARARDGLAGPLLTAVLDQQRTSRQTQLPASPRAHPERVRTEFSGSWADTVIARARGHVTHEVADPGDACVRERIKGLEIAGFMSFARLNESERIAAAAALAASTPRDRPDPVAFARIAADWQPSSAARRPGLAAAYWKGPAFDASGHVGAPAVSDGLLLARHRTAFVDYHEQQARTDTTRQRDYLKELPLTPRSPRQPLPSGRARLESLQLHRAQMDALRANVDSSGICKRDVALERMLLSTGLSMHKRR